MEVEYKCIEADMLQFECTDTDGKVYGVADTISNGKIVDTLVIDMEAMDEIEDSELFKRIVTARMIFMSDSYAVQEALNEYSN